MRSQLRLDGDVAFPGELFLCVLSARRLQMPSTIWRVAHEEKLTKLESLSSSITRSSNTSHSTVYFERMRWDAASIWACRGRCGEADEARPLLEGSSRRAMKIENTLRNYIFVERRKRTFENVSKGNTLPEYQDLADGIEFGHSDANTELRKFLREWPKGQRSRGVLDTFGNQVAGERR